MSLRRLPIGCQNRPAAERVKAAGVKLEVVDAADDRPVFGSRAVRSPAAAGLRDGSVELGQGPLDRCDELLANGRPRRGG